MLENGFVPHKNVLDEKERNYMKRDIKRTTKNLKISFFFDNSFYFGTVMNLSEKSMHIKTEIFFPMNYIFDVFIPLTEDVLKVTAKISRIEKSGDRYDAMVVELLNPDKKYLNFVKNLRSSSYENLH